MPGCQIMMLTPDTFVEFITCSLNQDFIRRMKYLVFDEVHLKSVAHNLWWSTHIPHTAQLILLSATIANIEEFKRFSKRSVEIISYHIRPIPLQYVLYRPPATAYNTSLAGFAPATLLRAGHLSLEINISDPTGRDLKSLDRTKDIPTTRDEQYRVAKQLMTLEMISKIQRDLKLTLETATTDVTHETIYSLLSYLFANTMQPAMVFFRTGEQVKTMVEKITAHIIGLETSDPDWKANQKNIDQYERKQGSKRDDNKGKGTKRADDWDEWDEQCQEQEIQNYMTVLYDYARKWRLPQTVTGLPNNVPQWIKTAVEYGIGIYVTSMPMYIKHFMFDEFKKGNINCLFADSSISVGINLPIRTVILCGDDIPTTLFRQAAGRAGRRGMDTQGYVIPLMSKERIYDVFTSQELPQSVEIQNRLTFSDLCRLNVPNNLDIYYNDERFTDKPDTVSKIKQQILTSYMRNHAGEQERRQLQLLQTEQWHYHKLTNLMKALPEHETIIVMRLLTTGALHRMEPMEFLKLLQLLFCRMPGSVDIAAEFDPKFIAGVEIFIRHYGLPVDIRAPVDDYFIRHCRGEKLDQAYSENIDRIGDWIYTLRTGLETVAPKEDAFRVLVERADAMFLAS